MSKKIPDYFLYRYRFVIGYSIVALAGVLVLAAALFYAPGGLSQAERNSVVTTSALSFQSIAPQSIIDAPYHVLQWASIKLFGVTTLSIKLPSIIIATLTGIGLVGLLSAWFRRNVAVLAAAIAVTTGIFLFLSQLGTPAIMPIFWTTWILFSALMVSRRIQFGTLWKIILFGSIALSLYTPLSAYILLALLSAVLFHPHLRYLVRKMTTWKVLIAIVCSAALITPLIYGIVSDRDILLTLLGIPSTMPDLFENSKTLAREYLSFMEPSMQSILTPIYSLGVVLFAVLGILRFFSTKYTARNYILTLLLILTIPLMALNPNRIEITFIPMILLVALGLDWLFRRWYTLFPVNPYARIVGFIPLSVLMGGIIVASVTYYIGTMSYGPTQAREFSHDLQLINKAVRDQKNTTTQLVVPKKDEAFYRIYAEYTQKVVVTSTYIPGSYSPMLVARDSIKTPPTQNLTRIFTDDRSGVSDRFYLYQK